MHTICSASRAGFWQSYTCALQHRSLLLSKDVWQKWELSTLAVITASPPTKVAIHLRLWLETIKTDITFKFTAELHIAHQKKKKEKKKVTFLLPDHLKLNLCPRTVTVSRSLPPVNITARIF